MKPLNLNISNEHNHLQHVKEPEGKYSESQKARMAKAAQDFESLLTGMMLKSMTKSTGGLFGKDNYGGDVVDVLFEKEMASYMTKYKGMGIAEDIYKKVTGEELNVNPVYNTVKNAPGKILSEKSDEEPDSFRERKLFNSGKIGTFFSAAGRKIEESNEAKVIPSSKALDRLSKYHHIIKNAAEKYGVEEKLIKSIILTESAAREKALSKAKAKGLMQLMDNTAKEMGVKNIWDPKQNIDGGTKYIARMLRLYNGDNHLALAAYNAGPGNVEKFEGIPPFKETETYVARVLEYYKSLD